MKRATTDALVQGVTTGYRSVAESMMMKRFGSLDMELLAIIPNIIKLLPSEFTPLLMDLSLEELIDRFADRPTD